MCIAVDAQIDHLNNIKFLQIIELSTQDSQFQSRDFTISEFFNGKIIRVSGQTLKSFFLHIIVKSI